MELFKQTRILSFMRYSNYGVVVSAILVLLALGLLFFKGFSLGIDFAGEFGASALRSKRSH